jgi:hypothetical protein
MLRTFTVGLTAAIVVAIPGLAIASPITHPVVPQHLLAEIGDRPSIWNDAGRTDLTVASTAGVAATSGKVLAVFAPGTTSADHDLGRLVPGSDRGRGRRASGLDATRPR